MGKRVEALLVDDHSLILEGIKRVLGRIPEVIVADAVTSGEEAAELIEARDYDIYILDISLPGDLSGFDLIDLIHEINEDACIVVSTMHDEVWVANRLVKQKVNAVILKSSASEDMEKAVRSVMEGGSYTCAGFQTIRQKLAKASVYAHSNDMPTKRELEVLKEVAKGLSTHDIAKNLQIKESTVETFRKRLIQKLNARNAIDMVVKSIARGWISVK